MATERIELSAISIEVDSIGTGPEVVFLHGDAGPRPARPLVEELAARHTVHVPHLPGWGGTSAPAHVISVKDVADIVGEYLRHFDTVPTLIGASVGGWVAARVTSVLHRQPPALVLISPTGLKLRGREDRDFADIYTMSRMVRLAALYASPPTAVEMARLSEEDFVEIARSEEALARYCWQPYLHDPTMRYDLRRVDAPTMILHGERDGLVLVPDYYPQFAACIGDNATTSSVSGAGHRVEEEQPAVVAKLVTEFIDSRVAIGV